MHALKAVKGLKTKLKYTKSIPASYFSFKSHQTTYLYKVWSFGFLVDINWQEPFCLLLEIPQENGKPSCSTSNIHQCKNKLVFEKQV